MNVILTKEHRIMGVAEGDVTWKAAFVTQSSEAGKGSSGKSELDVKRKELSEGASRSLNQSWDCSHVEKDLEEGHEITWLEDDEMMRQWEEVSKEAAITFKEGMRAEKTKLKQCKMYRSSWCRRRR